MVGSDRDRRRAGAGGHRVWSCPATRAPLSSAASEWVERNIASFSHLIEPVRLHLEERVAEAGPGAKGAAAMTSRVMQAEMTAVLGVLARRVLGQYELVLPTGEDGDVVAFVGPNIMQMERTHQFRPSEFRFWVTLHEMTHRAQFQGIPWLRDYFMGLVSELVEESVPEPGRLNRMMEEITSRRESGESLLDERGLLGLFATSGQRAIIDKVQASDVPARRSRACGDGPSRARAPQVSGADEPGPQEPKARQADRCLLPDHRPRDEAQPVPDG